MFSTIPSTGTKLALELQNAGQLRYGEPDGDTRALWSTDGDRLTAEFEKLVLTTLMAPWPRDGDLDPETAAEAVA